MSLILWSLVVVVVVVVITTVLLLLVQPKQRKLIVSVEKTAKLPLKEAFRKLGIEEYSSPAPGLVYVYKPAQLDAPADPNAILTLAMHGGNVFQKKDGMWMALVHMYGRQRASTMMPETVDLKTEADVLDTFIRPLEIYAIKANIENGVGIDVVRGKDVRRVLRHWDRKTRRRPVVIQKVVRNPLLLDGKAFKVRIFLLRIRGTWYLHATGYVYRAKDPWPRSGTEVPSLDAFVANASSLKGRNVLEEYRGIPRTLREVVPRHVFDTALVPLLSAVVRAAPQPPDASSQAWALGADVIFDDEFHPWILECNIGPGTSSALTNEFPDLCHTRAQVEEDMIRTALPAYFAPPPSDNMIRL